jgi:hypothetical protein
MLTFVILLILTVGSAIALGAFSNSHMADGDSIGILIIITGVLMLVVVLNYNELDSPKKLCEAELPRHIECVWTPPQITENAD